MTSKVHRLELYNFKSYNGKVTVGPFNNFSCIVGPNGSGKSNLMDSLSFVLGTAATTLRGKKPADFINRDAKKQEASVSLILRNSTGTEVALTRHIDSKGKISVSVDKHTVTEKEFVAVLKKFRIGHRVSSFLVFQHEVEAVAQKKAKELTELLEEISGSVELKDEYIARRKALDEANEKLTAASMEKRGAMYEVNQMKLHKKEAEKFEEVKNRLIAERRDLALSELFHVEVQLNKQKEQLEEYNEQVKRLKTGLMSEEEIKKTKKEYSEKHKVYLELLKDVRKINHDHRDKSAFLDRIRASIDHHEKKLDREEKELKGVKESSTVRSKEVTRLEEQLEQHEAMLKSFEEQYKKEDAEAAKQGTLSADHIKEYKKLRNDADCETISLRQELETIRRQRESLVEGMKQVSAAIENKEDMKKNLSEVVKRNENRVAEIQSRLGEMKVAVKELESKKDQARAALHQIQTHSSEREEELRRVTDQLHELRHMKEDNRHGNKVNDALKALKSMHPGIQGRLVDLCSIPNQKYRNAVTVAMGKNLEGIVVDNTDTALACIKYLKEQRVATMSFIPLASAQGKAVDDRMRTFGGSCRPVVDVIKYDASIEPAIRFAVGQTLVCDGLEEAKNVAYGQSSGQRYKVVTTDGTALLKNGSIQGGLSTIQSRARKWDDKLYEDLKAAREKLLREGAGATDAEEARNQVEAKDVESRLEFAARRMKQLEEEARTVEKRNQSHIKELNESDKLTAELKKRKEEYTNRIAKVETSMGGIQEKVSAIEQRIFGAFEKKCGVSDIAKLEEKEAKKDRERTEQRQKLAVVIHKLKTSIEAQSKKFGERNVKDVESVLQKTRDEIKACQKDFADYKKIMDNLTKKQESAQEKVTTAKAELDSLESTLRNRSKDSESELRKLAQARKGCTTLQASCDALRQQRLSLFQQCKMEEIELPTTDPSNVGAKRGREDNENTRRKTRDDETLDNYMRISEAFTSFTESEGSGRNKHGQKEISVCIDFSGLNDVLRFGEHQHHAFFDYKSKAENFIDQLERELDSIAPNLKASARFSSSEAKLGSTANQLDECRERARKALTDFTKIKELRTARFMDTFEKIVENVDNVYRELTLGTRAQDVHGSAYLSLEDAEEPYNGGTKYHATPPMKRFMTIELLSGGERTMAALALLFAIHKISPAPFFVLDEVDAALDAANVGKLAHYLRSNSDQCQFLVVSLKDQLYHKADSLLGVYKDQERQSSGTLTLDLRQYANETAADNAAFQ